MTYKFLSMKKKMQVNHAKQVLQRFYDKAENQNLRTLYLVSGDIKDERRVMLVTEELKDNLINKMDKIISVHLYSIQSIDVPLTKDSIQHANAEAFLLNIYCATIYTSIQNISVPIANSSIKTQVADIFDDDHSLELSCHSKQTKLSNFFQKSPHPNQVFKNVSALPVQKHKKKGQFSIEKFVIRSQRSKPKNSWIEKLKTEFEELESAQQSGVQISSEMPSDDDNDLYEISEIYKVESAQQSGVQISSEMPSDDDNDV